MRAEAPTKPGMYWIKYRRRTLIHTDMAELKISYLGRIWYLDGKMIDEIDIREWKPFWEEAGG